MRDHEGGELALGDDLLGELEHLGRGLGVEGRRVLVEEQQLGLGEGGHEQRQGLALAAGEQADLCVQAALQPQAKAGEKLRVLGLLVLGDAPGKAAALAAATGQGEVLHDLHVGGGTAHGVLEDAAQVPGALGLGETRDVLAVQLDDARVQRVDAGDHVEQRGLAGSVAADDGNEVAVVQGEVDAGEGALLGDGALVERLGDVREPKHPTHLPSCTSCAAGSAPRPRARTARARR